MTAKSELREQALALMREFPNWSDREIARQLGVGNKTISRWRAGEGLSRELTVESLTTKEVLAQLRERGLVLSPRQVRRWAEDGLLGEGTRTRRFQGAGSFTIWWPGVVDLALEVDRLLKRYGNHRDVLLGLAAYGYDVDEALVHRAYQNFLEEIRDGELLVPRLTGGANDEAMLRRRSLWSWRWALAGIAEVRGGIDGLSAAARVDKELELAGDARLRDVLYDQLQATRLIFRGEIEDWWKREQFMNALEDPPPRKQIEELHSRLSFDSVSRAVAGADLAEIQGTTAGLRLLLQATAEKAFERSEREGGSLGLTAEWLRVYLEILDEDPLVPARIAPFLLAVMPSDELQSLIAGWLVEAAMLFPFWRSMLAVLFTWPQLACAGWRPTYEATTSGVTS